MAYQFNVTYAYGPGRFKLQAFPNGNLASVVESDQTWATREEAETVCARVNAGDQSGLTFGLYADD